MDALEIIPMMDLFDSSSSSSSEDRSDEEELLFFLEQANNLTKYGKKHRILHRIECFDKFFDDEFEKRFRLPKSLVLRLCSVLESKLKHRNTNRNNPVPVLNQILIALRYYATGSFQIVNGDLFGVCQSTVSRIRSKVSKAIAELASQDMKFPPTNEISRIKEEFYKKGGIPHVVGVMDGTHIPIQSVGGECAEHFRNRKGHFSINTQIVAEANMNILDLNARWPGSCHDQMIFNFSKLKARLESAEFGEAFLLGDAGYACKTYLLTPLAHPTTPSEIAYNKAFIRITPYW